MPFATGKDSRLPMRVLIQVRISSRYKHSISLRTNLGINLRFCMESMCKQKEKEEKRSKLSGRDVASGLK